MFTVKSVEEVFKIIDECFSDFKPGSEKVSLMDAVGRVLAADIASREDIPGFNRSSVDGYAVMARETFGAGDSMPAQLELVGEVFMGVKPEFRIERGQAACIPTGGELPGNADAVVMIEYTENLDDGFIYIDKAVAPGTHVVFQGDDTRSGSILLQEGCVLRPQDIGAAAAAGYSTLDVKRKIKVGILSTGNELVAVDEAITGSTVRDINTYSLYAGLVEYGAQPVIYGITCDSFDAVREAVCLALQECDMVLVSGGSSVGTRDETLRVINSLGEPGVLVHGIAVKPGKPTIIGKVGKKAVFGLPGHPASAYFIFRIFTRRLLDKMNGIGSRLPHMIYAETACNYPSNGGREEFVPVRIERVGGKLVAYPLFGKSGMITLLSAAVGYIHLGRDSEGLPAGKMAEVILF